MYCIFYVYVYPLNYNIWPLLFVINSWARKKIQWVIQRDIQRDIQWDIQWDIQYNAKLQYEFLPV